MYKLFVTVFVVAVAHENPSFRPTFTQHQTMKVAREIEKRDEDIFAKAIEYALFAPFVGTPEWKDLLRDEELKFQAKLHRLANSLKIIQEEKATEYEALLYLHTASLTAPLKEEWVRIYKYLFKKFCPDKLPENIAKDFPDELNEYEQKLLDDLRKRIFKVQIKHLNEKRKQEQKQENEKRNQKKNPHEQLDLSHFGAVT